MRRCIEMEDDDEYTVEEYNAIIDLCHRLYPDEKNEVHNKHELYNEAESKQLKAFLIIFASITIALFVVFCAYAFSISRLGLDGLIVGIPCFFVLVIVGCYLIYKTRNTVYNDGFTFWDNLRD